ncbi:malonic semialdehyde reductase [Planctomycetes bacterium CA13]|uniref:Malonic semialdehyde reductase n=1 Tax=Novipirellula herctigrandis TaxID=2527986 RepID=A0A5C5YW83_9BACT|nr:malonic semialdehyde reductase [Planctomycetes bacterium CA13]
MSSVKQQYVNASEADVLESIKQRWSPYRFESRPVEDGKIVCCLEAARWAASSFNDQPWSWIVARRQESEAFDAMVGCLLESNRAWASRAGVLMISVTRNTFRQNGKPNRVALHDLGQAAAHMALQATQLGLQIHQMAGINLSATKLQYDIPDGHQAQTAIAIGYPDFSKPESDFDRQMHNRETAPRTRLGLSEQVFSEKWGVSSGLVEA